MFFKNIRPMQT